MAYGLINADIHSDSQGGVLAPISSVMRNRIINGQMQIDQRNAGASVATSTTSAYTYCLDRYAYYTTAASKFTVQQNAGSITPPSGFNYYLGITSTSAYSPSASDIIILRQPIEAVNVGDLGWGTANAKTVTLSFQVYSSLTGTFSGYLSNYNGSRDYPFTYTVSSANTWTPISVTITGDTSGTWLLTNTGNSIGINVGFNLGSGSTYLGSANAWSGTTYFGATGSVNVVGTNGATFYITGVQLEKGSSATGFEYRQYGTELVLCQRYFEMTFPQGTAPQNGYTADIIQQGLGAWTCFSSNSMRSPTIPFKVTKRTAPSITIYSSGNSTSGNLAFYNGGWSSATLQTVYVQDWGVGFNVTTSSGSAGSSYLMGGAWTASAEL